MTSRHLHKACSQLEMRIFLLVALITLIGYNGEQILSRKRRYLTFPEGSNFVITLSITKGLMWDIPTGGRPPWNSIVEFDALFKLPNTTLRLHERKKTPQFQHDVYKNIPMEFYYHQHRRDRREVYGQIEELLNIQGIDGHACIQRTLCEAKSTLKRGRSLLDDVLLIIFSMPDEVDDDNNSGRSALAMSTDYCEYWIRSCPFSFLQMLLS